MEGTRKLWVIFIVLIMVSLACSLGGNEGDGDGDLPVVVLVSPLESDAVSVGQQVEVVATASSSAGLSKIDLLVNGQVVSTIDIPSSPESYSAAFSWVPVAEGAVVLAVIGYDIDENPSEAALVTLQVAPSGGDGGQVAPDAVTQPEGESTIMCTPPPCGANEAYYCPGACPGGCGITCATFTPTLPPPNTATFTPLPPTNTFTPTPTNTPNGWVIPSLQIVVSLQVVNLATVETVFEQVSIDSGQIGYTTAACPAGTVVVSGGYASSLDMLVYTHSKDGNGWRAYARNNAGSSKLLNVYARCLKNTAGTTAQLYQSGSVEPGQKKNVVQACPSGSIVTGGGFASNSNGDLTVYNSSKSGNGWQVWAENTSGSSKQVNAYAICLSGVTATTYDTYDSVSVSAGGTAGEFTDCGEGDLAVGGGFASQTYFRMYNSSPRATTTNEWVGYAKNNGSSDNIFFNYAVCLTFD